MAGITVMGVLIFIAVVLAFSSEKVERNWSTTIACLVVFGFIMVMGGISGFLLGLYYFDVTMFDEILIRHRFVDPPGITSLGSSQDRGIETVWLGFMLSPVGLHQFLRVLFSRKGACWYSDGPCVPPYRREDHVGELQEMATGESGFIVPWSVVYTEDKDLWPWDKRTEGDPKRGAYYTFKDYSTSSTGGGTATIKVSREEDGITLTLRPSENIRKSPGVEKKHFLRVKQVVFAK
jgi:hypothetical protein